MKLKAIYGLIAVSILIFTGLLGCETSGQRNRYKPESDEIAPLVDPKYSLAADRQRFDELRKNIPAEKKAANDDQALILQLTSDVKRNPSEVRGVFDQMMRKKRDLIDRDLRREREDFNKVERKAREAFLREQASAREPSKTKKMNKEQRSDFFKEQDLKRKDFFSDEREKRGDFESQAREKRKNFEDYARGKTNEFNAEMRSFQKRFDDNKKKEAQKKDAKTP